MDQIANMINMVKNAGRVEHESVVVSYSKIKQSIADCLLKEGYIASVSKKVKKGEQVFFGENSENSAMYSIVVVPTYVMGNVNDSRPNVLLEAENAKVTGEGIVKGNFKKGFFSIPVTKLHGKSKLKNRQIMYDIEVAVISLFGWRIL